jgi:hypothetical protein
LTSGDVSTVFAGAVVDPATTRGLFIIDALGPDALISATAGGDDLELRQRALDPAVVTARRLLTAPSA